MRQRRVRGAILLALGVAFLSTTAGCFGRFRAMHAVYDFNKAASDNGVVRSLLMCAMIVIPVYEVTFLVDAIVLNTLDFFNEPNAVAKSETLPDGSELRLARIDGDSVRVRRIDASGRETSFDVVRVGANAGFVRAGDGRIVGAVERLPDGRLVRRGP
jgi:uncharacterized protein DUF3332